MSRDRAGLTISGFCITKHHNLCKREFDFGSEYLQRYFICECDCHQMSQDDEATSEGNPIVPVNK